MPDCRCQFRIGLNPHGHNSSQGPEGPFGCFVGSEILFNRCVALAEAPIYASKGERRMDVDLPVDSPELLQIFELIRQECEFEPNQNKITAHELRGRFFEVYRTRIFSKIEIEEAELLHIVNVGKIIARFLLDSKADAHFKTERYIVKGYKPRKTIKIGGVSPGHGTAVTSELKVDMEQAELVGLQLDPVVGADDLWKLTSSITLPRSLLRLQDEIGEFVDAESWPTKFSCKYFDDDGYEPCQLRYQRNEIEQLGAFDIAVTAERTMRNRVTATRKCVVSQKFRKLMETLKIKGIEYVPVRLV